MTNFTGCSDVLTCLVAQELLQQHDKKVVSLHSLFTLYSKFKLEFMFSIEILFHHVTKLASFFLFDHFSIIYFFLFVQLFCDTIFYMFLQYFQWNKSQFLLKSTPNNQSPTPSREKVWNKVKLASCLYAFVCVCMHLYVFLCFCMRFYACVCVFMLARY